MKKPLSIFLVLILAGCATHRVNEGPGHGMKALQSPHSVKVTVDRVEFAAKACGLNIFARIDHAAGAQKIGKLLRPTELLIFGNPQGGTPLMECAQSLGIELPRKRSSADQGGYPVGV